jgi:tetratricopeptide (TPR) repeat protein
MVADLGSTDKTISICQDLGCQVTRFPFGNDYSEVRNGLIDRTKSDWILSLNPWEALIQGHQAMAKVDKPSYYLPVINGTILSKEVRLWNRKSDYKFIQPVYEYLNSSNSDEIGAVLYSSGGANYEDNLAIVKKWGASQPTAHEPCYYEALTLMALGRYDEFVPVSERYMFMNCNHSISTVMNRYYYAMVQLFRKRSKPALQNLNICISSRPLMAEFWCLLGDVYYHILDRYEHAKEFYENAILLGGRRLSSDKWPMDISKYDEYPSMMIESCKKMISHTR